MFTTNTTSVSAAGNLNVRFEHFLLKKKESLVSSQGFGTVILKTSEGGQTFKLRRFKIVYEKFTKFQKKTSYFAVSLCRKEFPEVEKIQLKACVSAVTFFYKMNTHAYI